MGGMRTGFAAVAVALLVLAAPASAQDYPNRPVRLVVPFPPGGINDIVARVISQHLGERLGKQVIVDNRGGAGGVVGAEIVANAPKDGHTLLIVSLATAVNPWLYTLPYDPLKSFAPISMLVVAPKTNQFAVIQAVAPSLRVEVNPVNMRDADCPQSTSNAPSSPPAA